MRNDILMFVNIFQIEFKNFQEQTDVSDVQSFDNQTHLIYLGPNSTTIEVMSKVPSLGRYNILIKYKQPDHANFDILYKINADKQIYEGKTNLRHCPSTAGCRQIILQNNGAKSFELEENVTITFTVCYSVLRLCIFRFQFQ